jgi:hypothetical protein
MVAGSDLRPTVAAAAGHSLDVTFWFKVNVLAKLSHGASLLGTAIAQRTATRPRPTRIAHFDMRSTFDQYARQPSK